MLRRPSSAPSPGTAPGTSPGTAVLSRRGSARPTLGGARRRLAGRDVPAASPAVAAGVVPRMRRPRGAAEPTTGGTPQRSALDVRVDRHLARLQTRSAPVRAEAIDDDRARRDPDTTSFAAIPAAAVTARPDTRPDTRVASPADRPRTAEFPALAVPSPTY